MVVITDLTTIGWLMPELILVLAATVTFVGGAFGGGRSFWTVFCAVAGIAAAALVVSQQGRFVTDTDVSGPLLLDGLASVGRLLAVVLGVLFIGVIGTRDNDELASETLGMVLLAIAGLMLVTWAGDLLLLFLGLELISVPTYAILFIARRDRMAAESAVKYFMLSVVSSAMMLFGLSLLYGLSGTLDIRGLTGGLQSGTAQSMMSLLPVATILIYAGLGFKIAAVPFHFYAPDVYQATTNGNAGFLAVVPKVAGIVALVRVIQATLPMASPVAWQLAVVLAVVTMTLGNVCALWQQNVRRMMAYSSIAHAGYMLIGLAVGFSAVGEADASVYSGLSAALLYVLVYAFASVGTFAVLAHLSAGGTETNEVEQLAGLGKRRPVMAGLIAIFMFSLSGIPPLAGFWGKMTLFAGALSAAEYAGNWFLALAIIGALNAATAAGYYLRIVGTMYFRDGQSRQTGPQWTFAAAAAVLCAAIVIGVGLMPGRMVRTFGTLAQHVSDSDSAALASSEKQQRAE